MSPSGRFGPVVRVSYAKLYDTLGACLKDDKSTLLLYSLLHANPSFLEYVLVRTDLDTLVSTHNPGHILLCSFWTCSPMLSDLKELWNQSPVHMSCLARGKAMDTKSFVSPPKDVSQDFQAVHVVVRYRVIML
jgi:hypothetical protein